MQNDPRNYLFESYVKVLNHYLPKFFVFENVTGMLTAKVDGQHIVNKIVEAAISNQQVFLILKDDDIKSFYGIILRGMSGKDVQIIRNEII